MVQDGVGGGTEPGTERVAALGSEDDAGGVLRPLHNEARNRGSDDESWLTLDAGRLPEQGGSPFQDRFRLFEEGSGSGCRR